MTLTLKATKEPQQWTTKLKNQSVLLFNNYEDLDKFNNKDLIETEFVNKIRLVVYCKNATKFDNSRLRTDLVIPPYYYFIIPDKIDEKLKLYTFENRNDLKICHEMQQLVQINEFSTKSQKWINKPIFPKKYQNFHGCVMNLGAFYKTNNFLRFLNKSGDLILYSDQIDGPLGNVMKDVEQRLNFSLVFVACLSTYCDEMLDFHYLYNVIRTTTLDGYSFDSSRTIKWRNVMLNIQCS
jgi:hypothetical protein